MTTGRFDAAPGFVIALLGAESTGKTELARSLREAIVAAGLAAPDDVAVVGEFLREFCDLHGRTPRRDEQAAIAAEQTRRIDAAAARHALVIADTTALMTAIYHRWVFGDASLDEVGAAAQARADLTLVTALDLPWRADGLQRDGPQVRAPIDALIRTALDRIGRPYSVVHGEGRARARAALAAVVGARRARSGDDVDPAGVHGRWRPACERCDDPDCERRRPDAGAAAEAVSAGRPTAGPADRPA